MTDRLDRIEAALDRQIELNAQFRTELEILSNAIASQRGEITQVKLSLMTIQLSIAGLEQTVAGLERTAQAQEQSIAHLVQTAQTQNETSQRTQANIEALVNLFARHVSDNHGGQSLSSP